MDSDYIQRVYQSRREKYAERMRTGQRVRDVLSNHYETVFKDVIHPGQEPVVGNLVYAAARTISQRVGRLPRLDAQPMDRNDEKQREAAQKHEDRLDAYSTKMNVSATRLQAAFWLVTHDCAPLVVSPSPQYGIPVIEVRDPLTMLAGTVWPHKPETVDVLFADRMTPWQATALYPKIGQIVSSLDEQVESVTLGEYFVGEGVYVCLLEPRCVILDFIKSPTPDHPLVILPRGFTPDMDYHGQFDHVIPALIAQAKLFALVMTYAGQQVASETVVVGDITSNQGRWATGPGAVNQITPMPGASASKLTNNMSVQVFNELDRLERAIRLGGQFPAQLSGEPVATIATGRGMEQLTLTVDDNVAYWQSVLDDAFMRAYGLIPPIARAMMAPGYEDFAEGDVSVNVHSLSGADPAETVRLLQMQGARNLSRVTIMDRLPEIDSPDKEMERIDIDEMRTALIRSLDQQIGQGAVTGDVVAELIARRKKGEHIEDVWLDIQRIQQEKQAAAAQGGGQQPAPDLSSVLNPLALAGSARAQAIRAAHTGPEMETQRRAQQAAMAPTPGGGPPGGAGIPV